MKGIILLIVALLCVVFLISWAATKEDEVKSDCHELGGKLVRTKGYGQHCIDRSVFIDITGDDE